MVTVRLVLRCDCGFEARAGDEDRLVAEIRRHAWRAHGMALSREDARLLSGRAQPATSTASPKTAQRPRGGSTNDF